ncbi:potassium channel protein [Jiella endophytica]|uniref:Potassium channel protein n=1 Tax=Jiella endophytica TaxID=2558362 RepID=A0A4Y8RV22_9HYPH|nr:potassium channel family protein [Jiella endophytica]TFF27294.1 potassium channel protein [Jiella endophytica]
MPLFSQYLRRFYVALAELTWGAILAIAIAHFLASWLLLELAGESDFVSRPVDFVYYYIVTATTVGYGDLSPQTGAGRLVSAFIVLPGAIAIFTAVLGKLLSAVSNSWRGRMKGLGNFNDRADHDVVMGWREGATQRLLSLIVEERRSGEAPTVLIAKELEQNPLPDKIDYVRVERLADPAGLERAGAANARSIIVRGSSDDETLAAALVASATCERAHVVAYFDFDTSAEILMRQNPRIECVTSLSSELMVRAARDPGSSVVASLLLSAGKEDTAFSLKVPETVAPFAYDGALAALRRHHAVTLVGMARHGNVDLNCKEKTEIRSGDVLYYIADQRLDPGRIVWDAFAKDSA